MSRCFLLVVDHTASAQDAAAVVGGLGEWRVQSVQSLLEDSPPEGTLPSSQIHAAIIPVNIVERVEQLLPAQAVWLAYGSALDIMRGFFLGARDYLVEPWTATEAIARCRRALHLPGYAAGGGLGTEMGQVLVTGSRTVVLTARETALWGLLRRHAGRVVDRSTIAAVLGLRTGDTRETGEKKRSRAVDMTVSRLRGALGDESDRIETVRGRGYRLRPARATGEGNRREERYPGES